MDDLLYRRGDDHFKNVDLHKIFSVLIRGKFHISLPLNAVDYPQLSDVRPVVDSFINFSMQPGLLGLADIGSFFDDSVKWTVPTNELDEEIARGVEPPLGYLSARMQAQEASAMVVVSDGTGAKRYLSIGDSGNPGYLYIVDPDTGRLQTLDLPIMSPDIDWESISLVENFAESITIILMNNKGAKKKKHAFEEPGLLQLKILKGGVASTIENTSVVSDFHSPQLISYKKSPKNICSPIDHIVSAKLKGRFTCEAIAVTNDFASSVYLLKKKKVEAKVKKYDGPRPKTPEEAKRRRKLSSKERRLLLMRKTFDYKRIYDMSFAQILSGPPMETARDEVVVIGYLYEKMHRYLGRSAKWALVPTDACFYDSDLYILCHDEKSHPKIVKLDAALEVMNVYQVVNGYIKPEGLFVSAEGVYLADEGSLERGNEFFNGSETFFSHYDWAFIAQHELSPSLVVGVNHSDPNLVNRSVDELDESLTLLVEYLVDSDYLRLVSGGTYRSQNSKETDVGPSMKQADVAVVEGHVRAIKSFDLHLSALKSRPEFVAEHEGYLDELDAFRARVGDFVATYPSKLQTQRKQFEKAYKRARKRRRRGSGLGSALGSAIGSAFGSMLSTIFSGDIIRIEADILGDLGSPGRVFGNIDRETGGNLTRVNADVSRELTEAKRKVDFELTNAREALTEMDEEFKENVRREAHVALQKTGAALRAVGQPENLARIAVVYVASAYAGPAGAAFANTLIDKYVYNKDMTEQDMLESFVTGMAVGYAAEYVSAADIGSEALKISSQQSASIASKLASDAVRVAIDGESYSFEQFAQSIATGATTVDLGDGHVASVLEPAIEGGADYVAAQVIGQDDIDVDLLTDRLYEGAAMSVSNSAIHAVVDDLLIKEMSQEDLRQDRAVIEEFKDFLFAVCAIGENQTEPNDWLLAQSTLDKLIQSDEYEFSLYDDLDLIESALASDADTNLPPIIKPPFNGTPLGEKLSANSPVVDDIAVTPTPGSGIQGGHASTDARDSGHTAHWGVDLPMSDDSASDLTYFTGTTQGLVKRAGPAYTKKNKKGKYLGHRVEIHFYHEGELWVSKTMHHAVVLVEKDQIVNPGDPVALGGGVGDQFGSPEAGDAHVHWELKRSGKYVNPLSGAFVDPDGDR